MRIVFSSLFPVFLLLFGWPLMATPSGAQCIRLQCEHLPNPLGLDTPNPRFSWQLEDSSQGAVQIAYQIVVGRDSSEVASGKGDMWDSGKTKSGDRLVVYQGQLLKPFTRYFWAVQAWVTGKNVSTSPVAWFETGMMGVENWKGEWITDTRDIQLKPAPYFRKEWKIEKQVASARVYIAAAGLYEMSVNGARIGNQRLDPTYTRFDRRILYVTHDITSQLQQGGNAVGVLLGNGWYNHQSTAVWYFDEAPWRARPRFCLDLHVVYADGTKEVISSGRDWKTSLSPVVFNSIYTAEHIDGRLLQSGWDKPGFDDKKWANAIPVDTPAQVITAQALHPIRDVEEIPAVSMKKFGPGHYLFDFGRNISGVTQLKVSGEKGTAIRLIHAERLNKEGHTDLSNIIVHYRPKDDSDPFQTDIYYLNGTGTETFKPSFNYKGFQYVEVMADKPLVLTRESLAAYFMHSDVPPVGFITSSNPTLNKIWEATNNSYLSNLFGYPTDCPQREKNGWTGDAHIAIETALYNFDAITVYEKWLADFRDEQQPNGVLPAIIPTSGWGYTWANGPDWTSAIAIIPWNIYLFYGDARLLEQCYDNIRRYVDRITAESKDGLTSWGLGDWVPVKSVTPKEFTSSIYYFVDATILAKTAKLLGRQADAEKYLNLAEEIKSAINKKYLNEATGIYGKGLQTELSAALYWGIVPENLKQKVADNLASRVEQDGKHIDVGLLGTKTILNALSENGYADLAYEVALQESYPSWGWWIKNGATTLYENWNIDAKNDISLNHIMFGEIGAWFYKGLGGIFPDPEQPGFKHVILKPNFVPQLDSFEASHQGPYGEIVSRWRKPGTRTEYQVVVPPNSSATLHLPSGTLTVNGEPADRSKVIKMSSRGEYGSTMLLQAGTYTFTF